MKRWTIALLVLVVAGLLVPSSGVPATSKASYLVFVEDNVAAAANGDEIEVSLEGEFDGASKEASGSGVWTHAGVASGTLTLERLVAFQFYGCGFVGDPTLCGGRAIFDVHMVTGTGFEFDALLEVNCQIGAPPPGTSEGTKVNARGLNFNEHVSGENVFIALS